MTLITIGVIFQVEQYSETTRLGLKTKTERRLVRGENHMSNEVRGNAGPRLIMGRHDGINTRKVGEATVPEGPSTSERPNKFGLPDDLVRALVHPITSLADPTKHLVVGVVADYATRLVRLLNAKTQITAAVESVLKQFNGTLRVITFEPDFEKVRFEKIEVQVDINGEPLYPDEPRPNGLRIAVRAAIVGVLQPLGIVVCNIIIPSDYSESHELLEVRKDGPTMLSPPTQPGVAEVEADTDESGTPS